MVFKAQLGCALYHKHSLVWTQDTQKSECASQGSVYLLTGYRFEEALRRVGAISLPAIAVSAMLATSPKITHIVRRCAKRAGTDTNQENACKRRQLGASSGSTTRCQRGGLTCFSPTLTSVAGCHQAHSTRAQWQMTSRRITVRR